MNTETMNSESAQNTRRFPVWAIVLVTIFATVFVMGLIFRFYFYPKPFNDVTLNAKEEQRLNQKLATLIPGYTPPEVEGKPALAPEPYSEENAIREINFNEKEVNALLARNTDLSDKLAIDLSQDLVSAKLLVPLDPDFPIMGGKTVRITAGLKLSYENQKPIAILRGVSVMGVPIPSDWLGGLKNIDLVQEFGGSDGFWKSFAAGIEFLKVEDGKVYVKLKE